MRKALSSLSFGGIAILFPGLAWAQASTPSPDYSYGPWMMGWGGGWSGMVFGPLMLILVIVAVVVLVRWLAVPPPSHQPHVQAPLDILKARFARGEIDKQEYEDRRRTLGE